MSFSDKLSNGIIIEAVQFFHPCKTCCINCEWYYAYIETFVPGGFAMVCIVLLAIMSPMKLGQRWNRRYSTVSNTEENGGDYGSLRDQQRPSSIKI